MDAKIIIKANKMLTVYRSRPRRSRREGRQAEDTTGTCANL